MKNLRGNLPLILASLLVVAGIGIAVFGIPMPAAKLDFQQLAVLKPGTADFPAVTGYYAADSLTKYRVQQGDEVSFHLASVQYHAPDQAVRQAIVYLADPAQTGTNQEAKQLRQEIWQEAAQAIQQHSEANALFLSWWDNGQRIDWLTGKQTWVQAPVAAAFPNRVEQALWQQASGPFAPDDSALRRLANWLAMDFEQALQAMRTELPADKSVYWLISVDDLARVNEIAALSGKQLGFEARLFPQTGDIHSQISTVKRWAGEKGTGSYLVQTLPGQGIRAWRITDPATENTLFAKLLPFTSSLANPPAHLQQAYQSSWGGYLTIYHWQP